MIGSIGKFSHKAATLTSFAAAVVVGSLVAWTMYLPKSGELIKAVESGAQTKVFELLQSGADPNITDSGGMTPLNIACRMGRTDIILALLGHGADGSLTSGDLSPFAWAATSGNLNAVVALSCYTRGQVETKTEPALCYTEDPEIARKLLSMGAKSLVFSKTLGVSGLQNAVLHGRYAVATAIVESDPEINSLSMERDPILHLLMRSIPDSPTAREWSKIDELILASLRKGLTFKYPDRNGHRAMEYIRTQAQRDHLEGLLGKEVFDEASQHNRPNVSYKLNGESSQ